MISIYLCLFQRTDVLRELERAKAVFTKEATEVARHMGWVKSVIFSQVRSLFSNATATILKHRPDSTIKWRLL